MQNRYALLSGILSLFLFSVSSSQWAPQYAGLPGGLNTKQLYFAPVDPNTCWATLVNVSNSQGMYCRTTNAGGTWTSSSVPGAASVVASSMTAVDALTAWIVFAEGSAASGVYRTTNGGVGWTKQTSAFPSGSSPRFVRFFDAANGLAVGNPNGGYWEIYTTTDGGTNWSRVSSGNIPAPLSGEIAYIGGAPASYGNNFWFPTSQQSVYKTTNRGLSWTAYRNAFPGAFGFCLGFRDSLNGLAGGDNPLRVRRTTDGGASWTQVNAPSGITPAFLSPIPGTPGSYMVSSFDLFGWSPGSAYTRDDGATWTTIDNQNHGRTVFLSPSVGWSGGGNDSLYAWDRTGYGSALLPVVQQSSFLPTTFFLEQNYPNPFNPSTNIRFRNPDYGLVSLKVYDVLGREVRTLVNEQKAPGTYTVQWHTSGMTSGVYLYRLSAGAFVETKKAVVLK